MRAGSIRAGCGCGSLMRCARARSVPVTTLRAVGISAEAIPLEAPLEGGSEGVSVVIEPLEAGRARFPRAFFEYEGGLFGGLRALGIGVSDDGYLDVPAIRQHIDDYIVPPALGGDAGILGAIALAEGLAGSPDTVTR